MSANDKWSAADVPDRSGRIAVVTGANTGIGYHAAAVLAHRGAHVVFAVRNLEKGNAALARIVAAHPKAHPGGSNTELSRHLPAVFKPAVAVLGPVLFQSAAMGALPTLRAATDPDVEGGQYYGPDGFAEQRGHPKLVSSSAQSHDDELQRRLWTVSEEFTGVTYPV
jgi:NAD(P)-dependent dehydrogenase (short-subunit alcohol dehydrogenase family)